MSSTDPTGAIRETSPATTPPEASRDFIPPLVEGPASSAMGKFFYDPPQSETTLYRVPALNITFAITSLLLFLVTVWAIWQDHDREWKRYSREWRSVQADRFEEQISKEDARLQAANLGALETQLAGLREQVASDEAFRNADREARRAENDFNMAEIEAKFHKSKMDSERYYYEEARKRVLDGPWKDTERGKEELRAIDRDFEVAYVKRYEELQRKAEELKTRAAEARAKADELARARDETQKQIVALTRSRDMLQRNLRGVEFSATNAIRNAPLIPPFAPVDQIQKVVVADLTEPLNFLDVPRVDRCKTCHLNIDNPDPSLADFTDERSPHKGKLFRSHPRLDLFVGSASPHSYESFGCTICHYGDGHATDFEFAAHTPRDDAQREEWEEKYHWHKLHHQDFPMLPMTQITSTCAKCHRAEDRILGADSWAEGDNIGYNAGRELVEEHGCYGCHKIEGFEKYRKVGPSLARILDKTDPTFLYRWIKDPPGFRPSTKMPKFFDLDNTRGTFNVVNLKGELEPMDFTLRNEVEALALSTYLSSGDRKRRAEDFHPLSASAADPARGKELVKNVGCLGCHSIVKEGFTHNDNAPDLSGIGSKVNPRWMADWIVDPRKHDPKTRMPRLRVEQDEGGEQKLADIVAYLMSLKDPAFETRAVPEVDEARGKILREIAFDYLRRNSTRARAQVELEAMEKEGTAKLLAYAGERLVLRYGCFGCHEGISAEYDKAAPIGTELSYHGSKEVDKLDFARWGHQKTGEYAIPHTRSDWFAAKLANTRIFDVIPKQVQRADGSVGYERTGEIVQKTPEELLKMPLFSFRTIHDPAEGSSPDAEARFEKARGRRIQSAVNFLLSRLNDKIPPQKMRRLDPDEQAEEDGRNLIRFLNCQGCHRLGADPRDMAAADLPSYGYGLPEDQATFGELERETWLAENLRVGRMTIPAGTFLSAELKDENDPKAEEPFSVRSIATRWWESQHTPERERRLRVLGFGEGKVRRYFGDSAENRPRAAPLLRKEGERVHGDWLFEFLLDVKPLRPWLDIRMPSFHLTAEQAATLVKWFKVTTGAPYLPIGLKKEDAEKFQGYYEMAPGVPYPPLDLKPDDDQKLRSWMQTEGRPPYPHEALPQHVLTPRGRELAELGREMFKTTFPGDPKADMRLQCNSCHPAGSQKPSNPDQSTWGPDLSLARARLRPSWTARWLLDPAGYMPGTKMPNNFVSFSIKDIADGMVFEAIRPDYAESLEAILQYLMHMRELDAPPR